VAEGDVREEPNRPLRELMALAADRDMIARQYANGFVDVFEDGAPAVLAGIERTGCLEGGVIHAHLELMSRYPDSLIARKLGAEAARESALRARHVLAAAWPDTAAGREAITELDRWLRAEGNSRNPGTTADLITACLFVLLRTMRIRTPPQVPWTREGLWP
jgi:triphosphoribosyl-dephospho-CoA synthase